MFTPTGPFSRQTWRNIESLPGQALNALGQIGSYLGSPKAAQDYTNLLRGSVPGRVGSIPPSANGKSYRRAELELAEAARAGGGGGGGGGGIIISSGSMGVLTKVPRGAMASLTARRKSSAVT